MCLSMLFPQQTDGWKKYIYMAVKDDGVTQCKEWPSKEKPPIQKGHMFQTVTWERNEFWNFGFQVLRADKKN